MEPGGYDRVIISVFSSVPGGRGRDTPCHQRFGQFVFPGQAQVRECRKSVDESRGEGHLMCPEEEEEVEEEEEKERTRHI